MGNVYLILGASSDLGLEFLQNGQWDKDDFIVAQYYSSAKKLQMIQQNVNCVMEILQADFLSEESTIDFITKVNAFGKVPTHILHIPAVPVENKRFTEYNWNDVQNNINVQVRSVFQILQSFMLKMAKKKSGKIVMLLSSCTLNVPPKYLSAYIIAKYALLGMMKALAVEYASKYIQINALSPSMMETKFLANIYEQVVEQSAQNNPMKRNAKVKDVVPMIQFLFSEQAPFITGANIPITGGEAF